MRNVCFFLIALIVAIYPGTGNSFVAGAEWKSIDNPPFVIHYLFKDTYATFVSHFLYQAYTRIAEDLDIRLHEPIDVFLCPSQQIYDRLTANSLPEWSAAVAVPARNLIVLKSFEEQKSLRTSTIHELTHIMLHTVVDSMAIPRWFDEGLAVYYSDDKTLAARNQVSRALTSESIIPLDEIGNVLSFDQHKAQLAYQESYLTIVFIIREFGRSGLQKLIRAMKTSGSMDKALQQAFGMDMEGLEAAWYRFIRQKRRWNIFIDFEIFIWILILLLFLIGFVAIRLRNRHTLKRWEIEDEYDPW